MEVEKAARLKAEQAVIEKQQCLVYLQLEATLKVQQATEQLRHDLESRHK